jgi:7,8-dihydroneopterin aldolase/epimerase/oxygenase
MAAGGCAVDETAIAFELPHVRAAATEAAPPPDRISIRDYVRAVEIGAFSSERGVEQRLRFNVVLEVRHSAAAEDDDVDKVVSYDTITDAIETELRLERINLLETLAERVARRCLSDPRALRAFVRVEKLDRGPGALGVEIVRARDEGIPRLRPAQAGEPAAVPRPDVVYLPRHVLAGGEAARWRAALAASEVPVVVTLDPLHLQSPAGDPASLRIGLLSMDQAAWAFVAENPWAAVAASRTEIDHALRQVQTVIWSPSKLVIDAVRAPAADASAPASLALWLAEELGARRLVCIGAPAPTAEPTAKAFPVACVPAAAHDPAAALAGGDGA